ncbi:hypothetical protein LL05_05354 [Pseudomonas aeruginosa]|nr:hypothetical protein LL05_05354 [Pseudomonas aeruginosa]
MKHRLWVVALRLGAEQYRAAGDTLLDVEPVAADQGVAVFVEAEVVDQAFLEGQPVVQVVIAVAGLHAVFARQVLMVDALFVVEHPVFLEQRLENLRNTLLLEDPPVAAQLQARQLRFQQQFVAGPAKTRAALGEVADDAMDIAGRTAVLPEGEGARLVEYLLEIDGVLVAGQLQVQAERLAERFFQFELDDIEREFPFADDEGEFQVSLTHGSFPVPGGQFLSNPLEEQATLLLLSRCRKSWLGVYFAK